jgi:ABC-type cobalamin/Fe3+-siderophores transport system ATPase subunit
MTRNRCSFSPVSEHPEAEGTEQDAPVPHIEGQLPFEDLDVATDVESSDAALVEPTPVVEGHPPILRRVWFKRFKTFEEFTIELGRFNVLVGANNSGKSTVLQGIDLVYTLLKLHAEGDGLADQGRYLPAGVLPVASLKDLFFRRETRHANANLAVVLGAEFSDGSSIELGIRHLFGNMNSKVQNANGMDGNRLAALLGHPAVWVPSSVGIVRDEEYRTPARRTALINTGRHNEVLRNMLVELQQTQGERYAALQAVLTERFGVSLEDVSFDEVRDEYVQADMAVGGGMRHDLYSAGSGFVQVVQLLVFILAQSPSVVLLDEPDAHLHSSLQRAIVEILEDVGREQGFQVVVATHSKEVINFIDPTRLIFVQPGESEAAPMSDEVTPITVLRSLGAIDNVDAFALVKNRRCLFVEGTGDVSILGRFATTLGLRVFTGDERVVVIPTGGADQFGHVQQLDVFEQLLNSKVASIELRDRDARTGDDRQTVMGKASRPLVVFEKDSIESYLLNPDVVARVIKEVAEERSREVEISPDDVIQTLMEATEELKVSTVDRVAERYSEYYRKVNSEHLSLKTANEYAREVVESSWGSLDERLTLVSGKKLLSALRERVQDSYKVNFGNERLAEGFRTEEIPQELIDALQRVAGLETPPV